jgi:hypothetical protein
MVAKITSGRFLSLALVGPAPLALRRFADYALPSD